MLKAYQIEYVKNYGIKDNNLDKFICKMNKYNPHLLKNPYKLSCDNIACLECIYFNFDLSTNRFKCVADCQVNLHHFDEHLQASKIIENNLCEICESYIMKIRTNFMVHEGKEVHF